MSSNIVPMRITFLGCGNLNTALLTGILASLASSPHTDFQPPSQDANINTPAIIAPTAFTACVHHPSSAATLRQKFSSESPQVTVLADQNVPGVQNGDIVILGVEPHAYRSVLAEPGMREALRGKTLVSIIGGVSVSKLYDAIFPDKTDVAKETTDMAESQQQQQQHCHIIRVTPSTSAAVRSSVTLISQEPSRKYPPSVLEAIYSLFMRVGQVKTWPESLQPAGATMIAGGLAFFSLAVEGMVEGAVREGIEKREAYEMAAGCMIGLAKMIAEGESPGEVRRKVATPGGSTAAGLKVLEEGKVMEAYREALRTTTFRTSRLDDPKD